MAIRISQSTEISDIVRSSSSTPFYSLSPITRLTPDDRLEWFNSREATIYNKYDIRASDPNGIGSSQPYVYVSLTDSDQIKDLTKYDTQETPAGAAERDNIRINNFLSSGLGQRFKSRQILFQKQNSFPETGEYNNGSILLAVNAPATKDNRPIRHVDNTTGDTIEGSATGDGAAPYSAYAAKRGNAKYGLLRFATGNRAISNFNTIWGQGSGGTASGGSQTPYINQLRSTTPTNSDPYGQNSWKFRPEYNNSDEGGIYFSFLADRFGIMTIPNTSNIKTFYNDSEVINSPKKTPSDFHKYTPGQAQTIYGANADDTTNYYASVEKITNNELESDGGENLKSLYQKMVGAIANQAAATQQIRKSTEGYNTDTNKGISELTNYNSIPGTPDNSNVVTRGPFMEYLRNAGEISVQANELNINSRGFAKASKKRDETGRFDSYNILKTLDETQKNLLYLENGSNQSKDLIFFYFYDLINKVYIPFRATLGSIQDSHSPDWTDIKYMGRADTLFVYKGFTRDISFNFRVYANSIEELIPMWKRINYFVGLARPSKYTDRAYVTSNSRTDQEEDEETVTLRISATEDTPETTNRLTIRTNEHLLAQLESGAPLPPATTTAQSSDQTNRLSIQTNRQLIDRLFGNDSIATTANSENRLSIQTNRAMVEQMFAENTVQAQAATPNNTTTTTGAESGFMYPPMINFRIGDLYVDQPAVLRSIGTTIPEDAHWETLRDDTYKYVYGQTDDKVINKTAFSRQLPTIVDISVQLSIIERQQSITSGNHFGPTVGWENTLT